MAERTIRVGACELALDRGGLRWDDGREDRLTSKELALVRHLVEHEGETLIVAWPWIPSLGLELSLRFDGLGMLFAYLIVGIGLLVILYARYYLKPEDATGRFYGCLLLFMGAMLGVVILALLSVVGYYMMIRIGDVMAVRFEHTVWVAAFGPNLVMLGVGLWSLSKAGRPR